MVGPARLGLVGRFQPGLDRQRAARAPRRPCRKAGRDCRRPARTSGLAAAGASFVIVHRAIRHQVRQQSGKLRPDLPLSAISRRLPRRMAAQSTTAEARDPRRTLYRCVGSMTISRAATTAARDRRRCPTADHRPVSGVEKMDTVGAWLIYRAVRDRGAKVVGASEDVAGLLEQVAEADRPVQVRPEERTGRASRARRAWRMGRRCRAESLVGLVGFFGAALIGFRERHPPAQALPAQRRRPAVRPGRRARAGHHRPDELPDRHRHRPAGRGAARAVRRGNLHHQPHRPDHGSRARHADDGDHGRRPLGLAPSPRSSGR